jgi:hypothetical protein
LTVEQEYHPFLDLKKDQGKTIRTGHVEMNAHTHT